MHINIQSIQMRKKNSIRRSISKRLSFSRSLSITSNASTSTFFDHDDSNTSNNLPPILDGNSPHILAAQAATDKKDEFILSVPPSLTNVQESSCSNRIAISPFKGEEVILGPLLGTGEFSNVYEIKSFRLQTGIQDMSIEQVESREYMKKSKKYHNTSRSRYAVKHLKQNYIKDNGNEAYAQAAG